jgi:hypothetical protein
VGAKGSEWRKRQPSELPPTILVLEFVGSQKQNNNNNREREDDLAKSALNEMGPIEYRLTIPNFEGVQNELVLRLGNSYTVGAKRVPGLRVGTWLAAILERDTAKVLRR